jgi:hypothetical protein
MIIVLDPSVQEAHRTDIGELFKDEQAGGRRRRSAELQWL